MYAEFSMFWLGFFAGILVLIGVASVICNCWLKKHSKELSEIEIADLRKLIDKFKKELKYERNYKRHSKV